MDDLTYYLECPVAFQLDDVGRLVGGLVVTAVVDGIVHTLDDVGIDFVQVLNQCTVTTRTEQQ